MHVNKKKFNQPPPIRILVLGLPNTGKSTLINQLIGKNKTHTGSKPGITRHSMGCFKTKNYIIRFSIRSWNFRIRARNFFWSF